jgi:hypothetical protein
VGDVELIQGSLDHIQYRTFLTKGVTAAFANNFNNVFAERSTGTIGWYLDDYLAALFALMAPGARLATLHPLPLGLCKDEANAVRKKHGWSEHQDAAFFNCVELDMGAARDCVSWSEGGGCMKLIKVFKYIRVPQSEPYSIFLCCNPSCVNAQTAVPIRATTVNPDGRVVLNRCSCGFTLPKLRPRTRNPTVT